MIPGQSNRTVGLWTAAWLYLNSLPELPKYWEHANLSLNNYHTNSIDICSVFWLPDITELWRQEEEKHPKYTDLATVLCNISSTIPHGVGVEARFSVERNVIGWRQSKTTCESLHRKVVPKQFPDANNGILVSDDPSLDIMDPGNDFELKRELEDR